MIKRGNLLLKSSIFLLAASFAVIMLSAYYLTTANNSPALTGRATDFGVISLFVLPPENITLNLSTGWNLVSFFTIMPNYTVEKVLEPIEGDYEYVQEWDSQNQEFNIWSTNGQRDFTKFEMNKSYFIFMTQDRILRIFGVYFKNYTINLTEGWETPNYIYEYPSNITGNQFYNVTFQYLQKWNISRQEFMVYSVLANSQPFDSIKSPEGYFIRTDGGRLAYVRTA